MNRLDTHDAVDRNFYDAITTDMALKINIPLGHLEREFYP